MRLAPLDRSQLASARMDDLWHVAWRSLGDLPTASPYAADTVVLPIVADASLTVPERTAAVLTGTLAAL